EGQWVAERGQPLSSEKTCGTCHDVAYINEHSFHADLGAQDFVDVGAWNPLTNQTTLPTGDVSEWLKSNASRIVGGGFASQVGVEMDCLLCHLPTPNNTARIERLSAGQFAQASMATLLGSPWVVEVAGELTWNAESFPENGRVSLPIQDPANENCAQCHGVAHATSVSFSLTTADLALDKRANWQTLSTGQVVAPSKISASGSNISNKDALDRAWDIHVERGVACTDCHFSLNNPASAQSESTLSHLLFDPRRLDIGEYLQRPNHNFARGQSAQNALAPELKGTMRRCEGCHTPDGSHDWLPYSSTHMEALACESCHIPALYAPAVQSTDWTVLNADSSPVVRYRGVEGASGTIADLTNGYQPILLPRTDIDGKTTLAPYNLITSYFWQDTATGKAVSTEILQKAFLGGEPYAPEILAGLDSNQDGTLSPSELVLDSAEKQALVAERLTAVGVQNPKIIGQVYPYSINHNVINGKWLSQTCSDCHSDHSRLGVAFSLVSQAPAGVQLQFVSDSNVVANGEFISQSDGSLGYKPAVHAQKLYVFGFDRVHWIDWLGAGLFVGVLLAVTAHGGLRYYTSLRKPKHQHDGTDKQYLYGVYERFWHWMQTFAIVLLLITGLIIHRPEMFGMFSFRGVVAVHNTLAALLVVNALLSLFYHLVSGEIQQFIPKPYGFFDQAILQAKFYLKGIFRQAPHPFEKTAERKLNPLQQLTYFGILNVLLPLQIITGGLMWGVQQWGQISNLLGGLPVLAPIHSMVAWLFATFIVAHVYLTTTSDRPLSAIQAMMTGYE
ncbi:MAG TPA: cytochrome b/b6 domain-containing protein, partial [Anaerolineales bacterium]|nr:cytochrome b/b6 domain-containing protein [Anaerolineales bacterium]